MEQAKAQLREAYRLVDDEIGSRPWAMGEAFSLVDCAAAPALAYGETVVPFDTSLKNLSAYLERLRERPSFARVLSEAEPYFEFFPVETKPKIGRRQ